MDHLNRPALASSPTGEGSGLKLDLDLASERDSDEHGGIHKHRGSSDFVQLNDQFLTYLRLSATSCKPQSPTANGDVRHSPSTKMISASLSTFPKPPLFRLKTLGRGASSTVYSSVMLPSLRLCAEKVVSVNDLQHQKSIARELQSLEILKRPAWLGHKDTSGSEYVVLLLGVYYSTKSSTFSITLPYLSISLQSWIDAHTNYHRHFQNKNKSKINLADDCINNTTHSLPMSTVVVPLSSSVIVTIQRGLLSGLSFIHARGIIHRDIKPDNILLDEKGEVKIADFGISKVIATSELREVEYYGLSTSTYIGTLEFMSPERINGGSYSLYSDIWGYGITMLAMCLGRHPFDYGFDPACGGNEGEATQKASDPTKDDQQDRLSARGEGKKRSNGGFFAVLDAMSTLDVESLLGRRSQDHPNGRYGDSLSKHLKQCCALVQSSRGKATEHLDYLEKQLQNKSTLSANRALGQDNKKCTTSRDRTGGCLDNMKDNLGNDMRLSLADLTRDLIDLRNSSGSGTVIAGIAAIRGDLEVKRGRLESNLGNNAHLSSGRAGNMSQVAGKSNNHSSNGNNNNSNSNSNSSNKNINSRNSSKSKSVSSVSNGASRIGGGQSRATDNNKGKKVVSSAHKGVSNANSGIKSDVIKSAIDKAESVAASGGASLGKYDSGVQSKTAPTQHSPPITNKISNISTITNKIGSKLRTKPSTSEGSRRPAESVKAPASRTNNTTSNSTINNAISGTTTSNNQQSADEFEGSSNPQLRPHTTAASELIGADASILRRSSRSGLLGNDGTDPESHNSLRESDGKLRFTQWAHHNLIRRDASFVWTPPLDCESVDGNRTERKSLLNDADSSKQLERNNNANNNLGNNDGKSEFEDEHRIENMQSGISELDKNNDKGRLLISHLSNIWAADVAGSLDRSSTEGLLSDLKELVMSLGSCVSTEPSNQNELQFISKLSDKSVIIRVMGQEVLENISSLSKECNVPIAIIVHNLAKALTQFIDSGSDKTINSDLYNEDSTHHRTSTTKLASNKENSRNSTDAGDYFLRKSDKFISLMQGTVDSSNQKTINSITYDYDDDEDRNGKMCTALLPSQREESPLNIYRDTSKLNNSCSNEKIDSLDDLFVDLAESWGGHYEVGLNNGNDGNKYDGSVVGNDHQEQSMGINSKSSKYIVDSDITNKKPETIGPTKSKTTGAKYITPLNASFDGDIAGVDTESDSDNEGSTTDKERKIQSNLIVCSDTNFNDCSVVDEDDDSAANRLATEPITYLDDSLHYEDDFEV